MLRKLSKMFTKSTAESEANVRECAQTGDIKRLEHLLSLKAKEGFDINAREPPLSLPDLSSKNKSNSKNASPSKSAWEDSHTGDTAVVLASRNGHDLCLTTLIRAGADVNVKNAVGFTAVMQAAKKGHTKCLQELIKANAELNTTNKDGYTAVMYASMNGHVECLDLLIRAGANLNVQTEGDWTAAMLASRVGRVQTLELLIRAKADLNLQNSLKDSAVLLATFSGRKECLELLIRAGADLVLRDNAGKTAWDYANEKQLEECKRLLQSAPKLRAQGLLPPTTFESPGPVLSAGVTMAVPRSVEGAKPTASSALLSAGASLPAGSHTSAVKDSKDNVRVKMAWSDAEQTRADLQLGTGTYFDVVNAASAATKSVAKQKKKPSPAATVNVGTVLQGGGRVKAAEQKGRSQRKVEEDEQEPGGAGQASSGTVVVDSQRESALAVKDFDVETEQSAETIAEAKEEKEREQNEPRRYKGGDSIEADNGVEQWDVEKCVAWLGSVKLPDAFPMAALQANFRRDLVTGRLLLQLDDDTLHEMGVERKLHRLQLLTHIAELSKQKISPDTPANQTSAVMQTKSPAGGGKGMKSSHEAQSTFVTGGLPEAKKEDLVFIEPPLGKGASKAVFAGTWKGNKVALAQLTDPSLSMVEGDSWSKQLREFTQELRTMANLRHPNIVQIMAACTTPPDLVIITELLACNLAESLSYSPPSSTPDSKQRVSSAVSRKPPPVILPHTKREMLRVMSELVAGVQFMHSQSPPVLHRDLKSANVLLTTHGQVKVADFGISTVVDGKLTRLAGTPGYMAPEVLSRRGYGPPADIFSLGIIFLEIAYRKPPFTRMNTVRRELLTITPECPESLVKLVRECLEEDPEKRPTAPDIARRLQLINA